MATQGFQVFSPIGLPAAWGTGTADRNAQKFTGTTSVASAEFKSNRWFTCINGGTVNVYLAFGPSTVTADATAIPVPPGGRYDCVIQQGGTFVAAFASASGAAAIAWMSEGTT